MKALKRAGMGTTIGIVLTIIGIALIYILGSDMISRGSRMTFERAIYAARATSIGQDAIREVIFSQKREFLKKMVTEMNTAMGISDPNSLGAFLKALNPGCQKCASSTRIPLYDPDTAKFKEKDLDELKIGTTVVTGIWKTKEECDGDGITVGEERHTSCCSDPDPKHVCAKPVKLIFGKGGYSTRSEVVRRLAETELQNFKVKVGDVNMRVVWLYPIHSDLAEGVARAKVQVDFKLSRGWIKRTLTEDYRFTLKRKDDAVPTAPDEDQFELSPDSQPLVRYVEDVNTNEAI